MTIIIKDTVWQKGKNIFLLSVVVFFLAVIAFCGYYLVSGHDHLTAWYLRLNGCFYNAPNWEANIFTKSTKADGNLYCVLAIVISVAGLCYIYSNRKEHIIPQPAKKLALNNYDLLLAAAGITAGIFFWQWGNHISQPAYDEVFSAQNAAGIHPFQCISYYMLPNNHLFFNLLNNLIFHSAKDKVVTGRIISLFAYCSFITLLFFWFKGLIKNRWLAWIVCLTLALQFQVWGFGFQARGYELYLLCEWGALISLLCYLQSQNTGWLLLNVLCCATGYFCMPSYLYFHIGQLVFMLLYQLCYFKKEIAFWKYQLFAVLLSFLFYLPTLCFSGLQSVTKNSFVLSMDYYKTRYDFWKWMYSYLPNILDSTLTNPSGVAHTLVPWLFLIPLILLFNRRNKMNVLFGLFYLVMWITFIVVVTIMKKPPFECNLIGHESITLAGIILVIHWLTGFKIPKIQNLPRLVLFPGLMLLLALLFITTNKVLLRDRLYECEINNSYRALADQFAFIPTAATITFSDEAFYVYHICQKKGCKVSKCSNGTEDYFIEQTNENFVLPHREQYSLLKNISTYSVYKRK